MSRPGRISHIFIVRGTHIIIAYDCRYRCATGLSPYKAGDKLRRIRFLSGGRVSAARSTAGHEGIQLLHIYLKAGGQTFHSQAYGRCMGLTEYSKSEAISKAVAHSIFPPSFL